VVCRFSEDSRPELQQLFVNCSFGSFYICFLFWKVATVYIETEDLPEFVPTNSVIRRTDPLTYYKKQFVAEDKKQCRLLIELRNEENRIFCGCYLLRH